MRANIQIHVVFFSVGMFNIYMCKDIDKTKDYFDSISDLKQPVKFSSFLSGMKIY